MKTVFHAPSASEKSLKYQKLLCAQLLFSQGSVPRKKFHRGILTLRNLQKTDGAFRWNVFLKPFQMLIDGVFTVYYSAVHGKLEHVVSILDEEFPKLLIMTPILFGDDRKVEEHQNPHKPGLTHTRVPIREEAPGVQEVKGSSLCTP